MGGTSLPIDRKYTATLLGFDGLVENSIDATSSRDFAAEYVCNIAILMTNISRIAEDFIIWSSSEFSFVEFSDKFASPSSVMPQKKNPDIMELTRGKAALVIGESAGIMSTIKGLPTGYGRDLQEIKPKVWSSSTTAIGALAILEASLSSIKINEKNMKKATKGGGYMVALDIAEQLVLDGVPFREAHKITANLVQKAYNNKTILNELDLKSIDGMIGKSNIKASYIQSILKTTTASASLRKRKSIGSAGFAEQKRMITKRKKHTARLYNKLTKHENHLAKTMKQMSTRISKVMK
ncbi:MAG: argininosuccinate lyase [Cenarchaeum symbiont of Oopsacas minuta]|nr:argininosuccinate lyase [Cenarchaeum symbiont of Oopsacas minuta]